MTLKRKNISGYQGDQLPTANGLELQCTAAAVVAEDGRC